MQNSVDFCNIRLWSRISQERIDISKIGKNSFNHNHFHVGRKNLVNFGPQTTEIQWWILTHLNGFWVFSGDYNSALKGRCPFKFLHVLEIDLGYVAHPPSGTGVPQKNFNGENLKFGLKFRVCAPITSGPVGVSSRNFFQTTCRGVGVIMWVQLLEGPPSNFWEGQKTVHISARFLTTFDFDCKYLRKGSTYRKSKKNSFNHNHFHVGRRKLGELWSKNNRDLVVHIDLPKWIFSGDYISAIKGCCPFKFLPLTFRVCAPITSGPVGVSSRNFLQTTCREAGVIMWVQLLEGRPLNIGRAKKLPNFGTIFDNFRLWSRISPERIDISKIGTKLDQLRAKKNLLNFGPQTKEIQWCILTHRNEVNSGDYISALRGCCPFKFLHVLETDPGYLSHPYRDGVPSPQKMSIT